MNFTIVDGFVSDYDMYVYVQCQVYSNDSTNALTSDADCKAAVRLKAVTRFDCSVEDGEVSPGEGESVTVIAVIIRGSFHRVAMRVREVRSCPCVVHLTR